MVLKKLNKKREKIQHVKRHFVLCEQEAHTKRFVLKIFLKEFNITKTKFLLERLNEVMLKSMSFRVDRFFLPKIQFFLTDQFY